jgi:hypothetical protein
MSNSRYTADYDDEDENDYEGIADAPPPHPPEDGPEIIASLDL